MLPVPTNRSSGRERCARTAPKQTDLRTIRVNTAADWLVGVSKDERVMTRINIYAGYLL